MSGYYEYIDSFFVSDAIRTFSDEVGITFRTDTGVRRHIQNTLLRKDNTEKGFPFERVIMSLSSDRFSSETVRYFECSFGADGIQIKELDKSPY